MTNSVDEIGLRPLQNLPSVTGSRSSIPSLTKPSAEQMDSARRAAKKILGAYPDYGKAPPEYVVNFAEALSHLSADELAIVLHPKDGVATRCQYLPTIADIHAVLRDSKAKKEQFQPSHTNYRRLKDETGPWDLETDFERKKRVVTALLGYNPGAEASVAGKQLRTAPAEETVRNMKLKTPAAVVSDQLIDLLEAQGWPFIPDRGSQNKTETQDEQAA